MQILLHLMNISASISTKQFVILKVGNTLSMHKNNRIDLAWLDCIWNLSEEFVQNLCSGRFVRLWWRVCLTTIISLFFITILSMAWCRKERWRRNTCYAIIPSINVFYLFKYEFHSQLKRLFDFIIYFIFE